MNFKTRRVEEPEVNLTSLIDVVLLLLIFFMISTSFVDEATVKIRLPEATGEAVEAPATKLEITVSESGDYSVNNRPLVNRRADTLRRALVQTVGDRRDLPVTIRADANASHQAVVTAMDVAGRLGFTHLNIAISNRQEDR